jgi:hypothetical protein
MRSFTCVAGSLRNGGELHGFVCIDGYKTDLVCGDIIPDAGIIEGIGALTSLTQNSARIFLSGNKGCA